MRKILSVIASVKCIDILLLSAWIHGGLLYYISTALRLVTGNENIGPFLFVVYYSFLFICSYRHWIRKIQGKDIGLIVALTLIVLLSYAINTQNQENILENAKVLFVQVIPFYFVGLMLGHSKKTFDLLYLGSVATIIVNWLYVFLILGTGRQMQEDNLAISYSVLPHALMAIWYALEKKSVKTIFVAAIGSVFILSMGSRGPVLSCVVFALLFYITSQKGRALKKILLIGFIGGVVLVFLQTEIWEEFLLWIRELIVRINLSPRVIDAILYDAAAGSNQEREKIYEVIISYIKQRPFLGYGIYGEWSMINYSAHQMVLELWAHYGVIFGTIILIAGLDIMWLGYKRSPNHYTRVFVLLMISFGVLRGIYAGSYLSYYIFMLIGFCVSNIRLYKQYETHRRLQKDD